MSFRSSTRFFRSPHIWGFAIGSLIGLVSLEIILHYNQENNPLPEPADVEKRRKLVTREPRAAIAVIQPSCPVYGNITGIVRLTQQNKESKTKIDARIDGLKDGKHGFNICSSGDLSRGCASTGKHFNPLSKHHGDFKNLERHVGDLGNIESKNGVAHFNAIDDRGYIQLTGALSVIGRSISITSNEDDGVTQDDGHAGIKIACGVIGIENFEP